MARKRVGQITVKKVGKKYAACISGTPQELFNSYKEAEKLIAKLRELHGRRHYPRRKCKKKKKR